MQHEKPRHKVKIDGFFMDVTVVTNKKFKEFINETGYITVAERAVDWNEIKSQLPENTPKPHDSVLEPGSLVFKKSKVPLDNLNDFFQWWKWKIGANWNNVSGDKKNNKYHTEMICQLFMFRMKMLLHIVSGQTEGYLQKQNGNMQLEQIKKIIFLLGVIILMNYILMLIPGKEIFLLQIHKKMVMKD